MPTTKPAVRPSNIVGIDKRLAKAPSVTLSILPRSAVLSAISPRRPSNFSACVLASLRSSALRPESPLRLSNSLLNSVV